MALKDVLREEIHEVLNDAEKTEVIMSICESIARYAESGAQGAALLEASDGKGNSYETLKDMAIWLLAEGNALNVIHWNVDNNSRHELLNDAYSLCRDAGDQMAEAYIAITGKPLKVGKQPAMPSTDESPNAVLEHLKGIQTRMQEAVSKNARFSEGLKNIFADFDEKMTTIVYKWSRFQA